MCSFSQLRRRRQLFPSLSILHVHEYKSRLPDSGTWCKEGLSLCFRFRLAEPGGSDPRFTGSRGSAKHSSPELGGCPRPSHSPDLGFPADCVGKIISRRPRRAAAGLVSWQGFCQTVSHESRKPSTRCSGPKDMTLGRPRAPSQLRGSCCVREKAELQTCHCGSKEARSSCGKPAIAQSNIEASKPVSCQQDGIAWPQGSLRL